MRPSRGGPRPFPAPHHPGHAAVSRRTGSRQQGLPPFLGARPAVTDRCRPDRWSVAIPARPLPARQLTGSGVAGHLFGMLCDLFRAVRAGDRARTACSPSHGGRAVRPRHPGGVSVSRGRGTARAPRGALSRCWLGRRSDLARGRRAHGNGWSRGDSNPGPPPCKGGALPAKLRPPDSLPCPPGGRAWTRTRDLGLIRAAL